MAARKRERRPVGGAADPFTTDHHDSGSHSKLLQPEQVRPKRDRVRRSDLERLRERFRPAPARHWRRP
jgi:hypothetical protein